MLMDFEYRSIKAAALGGHVPGGKKRDKFNM